MWKITQASVQGRGHVKKNIPCQDKTFSICQNNVNVIVLADGAGSASLSHIGADGVTKNIGIYLCNNFDILFNQIDANNVRDALFKEIDDTIASLSKTYQCEPTDLASTLLAVAVKDESYLNIHLGDGVIGFYNGKDIKVASNPENGEFANTTCFTTSSNAKNHLRLFKGNLKDITGFLMFSDGPEPILYKYSSQEITPSLIGAFKDMLVYGPSELEKNLLDTLKTIRNYVIDDCSIIMMAKSPSENKSEIRPVIDNPYNHDYELDNYEIDCNLNGFSKQSAQKLKSMTRETISEEADEDCIRKSWTTTHGEKISIHDANMKINSVESFMGSSTQLNSFHDTNKDKTSKHYKKNKSKENSLNRYACISLLIIFALSLIMVIIYLSKTN